MKKALESNTVPDLTEELEIELRLLVTTQFPTANILMATPEKIEFLLDKADETLNASINKLFKIGEYRFSMAERTENRQIHVVLSK